MPPATVCPCTETLPKLAASSGFCPVRCSMVPEIVVVASPVVRTSTVAANDVTWAVFCPARWMAAAAVSDAPAEDADGLPDGLAAGVPEEGEHPATASAPAVIAMAPHGPASFEKACSLPPHLLCSAPYP